MMHLLHPGGRWCPVRGSEPGGSCAGDRLPEWITEAKAAGLPGISTFANGLNSDYAAVHAGLTTHWNSGHVEGAVNRIKMIKRQMYGRAGFSLLRKRVLLAP